MLYTQKRLHLSLPYILNMHWIEASFTYLMQIVEGCKGFPLAITVAGKSLCAQPIEVWQKRLAEWSKGSSILDSEVQLLLRLQTSLNVSNKEIMVKECFLDLGSFPEDKRIPVAALIDIWRESYDSLDDDILCVANLYQITNRSLANLVVTRCAGSHVSLTAFFSLNFLNTLLLCYIIFSRVPSLPCK